MYKDYQDFFVNRLIKLRMKNGVSARGMSRSIGQSDGYIAQIERKHNLPSMNIFFYICDYLKISPKEFFDDEVESPAVFCELADNLKELEEEQLVNVNNIVKGLIGKKDL